MIAFNLSAFFFFYFSLTGIYVMYMPKILQIYGYSALEIGIVFSFAPLVRFLLPFLFLRLIKLNDKIFYISLFGLIFSSLLFYISVENFYLFLLPNLLLGASMGLILPYVENYALEYLGKERYGKIRLYGSLGFIIIGLILAKTLDEPVNGLHFFLISSIITVVFAIKSIQKKIQIKSSYTKGINFKKHLGFWLNIFLVQVSFGAFYNFFTIYNTELGFSLDTISYFWTFGVICEILFFYFQAPILKKYSPLKLLGFATLITAIRWFLLYLFAGNLYITYLTQSIHAFSFALFHTVAFSYLSSLYENKKLAAQFYYGIAFGLGGFLGSFISGLLYGKNLFLYSSLIALLAFYCIKSDIITKKEKACN